jgi:hypothetical protein
VSTASTVELAGHMARLETIPAGSKFRRVDATLSFAQQGGPAGTRSERFASSAAESPALGGVKRAPRGNSMGQMGQRVRHG